MLGPFSTQRGEPMARTARRLLVAAACLLAVAACGDEATAEADGGDSGERDEQPDEDGGAPVSRSSYLDELYAPSLHDTVSPADPGSAYLEVGGDRYEFEGVSCSIDDTPGASRVNVSASNDDGHHLYLSREIGPDVGFDFENEHVQFAYLTGEGEKARYANFMAQLEREEGQDVEWLMGSGESPLVHIVGTKMTAAGEFKAAASPDGAPDYNTTFTTAITCP